MIRMTIDMDKVRKQIDDTILESKLSDIEILKRTYRSIKNGRLGIPDKWMKELGIEHDVCMITLIRTGNNTSGILITNHKGI